MWPFLYDGSTKTNGRREAVVRTLLCLGGEFSESGHYSRNVHAIPHPSFFVLSVRRMPNWRGGISTTTPTGEQIQYCRDVMYINPELEIEPLPVCQYN